jgi:hypothetical protein
MTVAMALHACIHTSNPHHACHLQADSHPDLHGVAGDGCRGRDLVRSQRTDGHALGLATLETTLGLATVRVLFSARPDHTEELAALNHKPPTPLTWALLCVMALQSDEQAAALLTCAQLVAPDMCLQLRGVPSGRVPSKGRHRRPQGKAPAHAGLTHTPVAQCTAGPACRGPQ